jgi:hypothetical protein
MNIEYGVKTKKRPNIAKEMKNGDVLHVGTEDKGEVFLVAKVGKSEFIFQQIGNDTAYAYSRGVVNQKIMDFDERYDVYYIITQEDLGLEEEGINR